MSSFFSPTEGPGVTVAAGSLSILSGFRTSTMGDRVAASVLALGQGGCGAAGLLTIFTEAGGSVDTVEVRGELCSILWCALLYSWAQMGRFFVNLRQGLISTEVWLTITSLLAGLQMGR